MPKPPFKPLALAAPDIERRPLQGGGMVLRAHAELSPYPDSLGELLYRWAERTPERVFLAERDGSGAWRKETYRAVLASVERIAQGLIDRGLDETRPIAVISDNGLDFALLMLAGMHVGVPVIPISAAYSLMSKDHAQLKYILELTRPGLVYAADGAKYGKAISAAVPMDAELVVSANPPDGVRATAFADLLIDAPSDAVQRRFAAVGPDTVAKILFTSGSTGTPKGVINTQRMLCSNQQALAQLWPFLEERPPVIVDWLPWNHTFGSNHNFNLILRNGGTLYIDHGKPAPGLIDMTIKNLREVPATIHFNVPRGFDMLIAPLERDTELRTAFFRDLDLIFYAGAALPQHLWDRLEALSIAATGRRVVMVSSWGSTETAPLATSVHFPIERAGVIGVPIPGTEIKLAATGGRFELRVKGPNVTPGYWRRPELSTEMRDEDGFLKMGDAGQLADAQDVNRGILFDGRLAENFKLMSGVWVLVGELRNHALSAMAPVAQDAVVTGEGREEVGLLVFPNPAGCRSLCRDAAHDAALGDLIRRPEVRDKLAEGLRAHNADNQGSSRRIARALLMAEPPSIDAGEITDKGYINQRAVLQRRATLVERLHSGANDPEVIRL